MWLDEDMTRRILTADEAAEVISLGTHAQAGVGTVEIDVTAIDMVRAGLLVCSLDEDNVLGMQITPAGAEWLIAYERGEIDDNEETP